MSTLIQDIRYALRIMPRNRGVTAVAILSVAITAGITGVVFTALKTVLIDPLPYAQPSRMVVLRSDGHTSNWVSWADMEDVRRRSRTLQSVGTYHYALLNLRGGGGNPPQALYGLNITADLFPTLGVSPMIGRNILPEEDLPGRNRELILSYGLWKRRFGLDRNILGRTMIANGYEYKIIGVMPPGFDFPLRLATTVRTPSRYMEFWAPYGQDPAKADRANTGCGAVARLRPGVSERQAGQDLASIARSLAREYPLTNKDRPIQAIPLAAQTFGYSRPALLILMAAAAMFLLIGCSNVANLLLARALARQREIAVRLALGGTRRRIVRQLITESCLLALIGGLGGYLLTAAAWTFLPAITPQNIPRLADARADWSIFAFILAISLLNGLLFGMVPALRSSAHDPAGQLRESGSRGSGASGPGGLSGKRLRSAFVISEIAITVVLVVAGSLLTGSFISLLNTPLGFDPDGVLASIIVPIGEAYNTPAKWGAFFERVLESARTLPGVASAGLVDALPFSGQNGGADVRTGHPGETPRGAADIAEFDRVSADYLQTLRVRLLEGRWFRKEDETIGGDLVIIDANAARKFFPGQDPIGKSLCINCDEGSKPDWKRVVGVVNPVRHYSIEAPAEPAIYQAFHAVQSAQFLVLRTRGRALDLAAPLRRMMAQLDPNVPVYISAEMSSFVGDSIADRRFIMALLAVTGILALALAAAGVYAVVAYSTSQRTGEIGTRMALGATRGNVQMLVLGEGMRTAAAGLAIGLALSLAVNHVLRGVLAGLGSSNAATIAAALALVTATVLLACFIPARRATRIEPMAALRHE